MSGAGVAGWVESRGGEFGGKDVGGDVSMTIIHANAAGLVGGYSVCGDPQGDATDDLDRVTCPDCLANIETLQKNR